MLNVFTNSSEKSEDDRFLEEFQPENLINSKILKILKDDFSFSLAELASISIFKGKVIGELKEVAS
jgi:hypothetical protein